ncbi:Clp1/GlmU family protein [Pyrobaculum ferrireducens]|uniref:polynucleotide 5'-hydroxyl-kinase n=1 Tax=Pyrobaculum ferrireducens TaxID=1104324 RepID=G7VBU0_9CREN|nr:Clp1/GlmU family protein [Pyrobaculum ferrireducens]AET33707.1 GTPase [Pyrobaculum ferrireducens]
MFKVEVPGGYTALVRGPAHVQCEDLCEVFGGAFQSFAVPPHKQYPVEGPAKMRIESGELVLVRGAAVPPDWRMELEGTAALLGPTDSGKSSLSTYLLNIHVRRGRRVCVVDADVGQADIGPPGFVAYSCTSAPVPHVSELEPHDAYYIGATNIQGMEDLFVAGVVRLLRKAAAQYPHLIIVNTPGWATGRGLQMLKALADAVEPTVVNIGEQILPGRVVTKPRHLLPRGPQERRELRNLAYRRHIKLAAKLQIEPQKITNCRVGNAVECPWGRYTPGDVPEPQKKGREYTVPPHYLRNLLVALYRGGRLAGYGVVERLDPRPVLYATTTEFDEVHMGKIRIDPQTLQELEPLP